MSQSEVVFKEFEPYTLSGIQITERELGRGSYASVVEIDYRGLKCAGKKIHQLLSQQRDSYSLRRFAEECRLLSQMRHPNVVQFLGVHFEDQVTTPILVMEYLPTNLSSCIDKYGILPEDVNYSILHDVSLGLSYLHNQTPPIIHRDLSANNVLLTSNMEAKISDFGVAKILNITPLQMSRMTETPGTPTYMPPEVMIADPKYNTSVDIFSYGIVMIHVFSGKWPHPKVGPTHIGSAGQLIPVSEAERREEYLRGIGPDHPLMDLILECLHNDPIQRGNASNIVQRLKDAVVHFPPSFANKVEILSKIEALENEKRELMAKSEQLLEKQIKDLKEEKASLTEEHGNAVFRIEISKLMHVERLQLQLKAVGAESNTLERSIKASDVTILAYKDLNETQKSMLAQKDERIESLSDQLTRTKEYLFSKLQPVELKMTWTQCADLPMTAGSGQTTVINNKVYYGGFHSDSDESSSAIFCFDPSQDTWSKLLPLPVKWFGLGQVKGELVTVGGQMITDGEKSNNVFVFNMKSKMYQPLPPMQTARSSPAVASLPSALLVAGGSASYASINDVEIFDADTSVWLASDLNSLPTPCHGMSALISNSTCYLIGGYDASSKLIQLICAPVDKLLQNALSKVQYPPVLKPDVSADAQDHISVWKQLAQTPNDSITAALLGGDVLCIGGYDVNDPYGGVCGDEVYMYISSTDSWRNISSLPSSKSEAATAILSPTDILVIGGWDDHSQLSTVFKGTVALSL